MIFITGDTHGDFRRRFSVEAFPEQKDMTKEDYLIICGDFGGVWEADGESKNEKYWLDWFDSRNYTLLFVDGNHENFDRLYEYPEKEWHGGRVHVLRPSVLHLMRGQVFELNGKKFFAFGGASSHDITDGILEKEDPDLKRKKKELEKRGALYRVNHLTWWERELASKEEMREGEENLRKHDNTVDFIITHCCATSTQAYIRGQRVPDGDRETDYLENIKENIDYRKWFFGHYHMNENVSESEILLYEQLLRVQ